MSSLIDKLIATGLLLALAFTTLALGTVEAWSVALFEILTIAILLLWSIKAMLDRRWLVSVPAVSWPVAGLIILGLIQSVALFNSSGRIESLSMDVEATRGATTVIFFLFVCSLVASTFFRNREQLRMLANFLVVFGLVLAVFALVQHSTWDGKLFWIRPTPAAGAGTGGPFVNRNHFAGYMEMLIPIPVAIALSKSVRVESRIFFGFAAAVMGISHLASLSRGGLVSLAGGLVFLASATIWRDRSSRDRESKLVIRPMYFIILTVAAIVAGVIWVGADLEILRRFTNDPLTSSGAMDRASVWGDTVAMFKAHPLTGIGLGAFETVYPIFGRGNGTFLIQFAHNDYLQILADGGVVGGGLAVWFVVAIARAFIKGMKSSDRFLSALSLGAAAGIFGILIHSIFDFNLQIPSNALLFLTLAATVSSVATASAVISGADANGAVRQRLMSKTRRQELINGV